MHNREAGNKMKDKFVLKGNIIYAKEDMSMEIVEHGYLVCKDGKSAGVYKKLPNKFSEYSCKDYKDCLIIPGMVDLHVHAPQYVYRGTKMDLELLDWLNENTFPEESKYQEIKYAKKAYKIFVEDLKKGFTTRACIFGTLHLDATTELMKQLEEAGLYCYVGLVNMNRNSPEYLCEKSVEEAISHTRKFIDHANKKFKHEKPIITPRFIPTCSDELMQKLSLLREEYQLPVQSHLSENQFEIAWVKELNPKAEFYGDAYDMFGLFGGNHKAIMAHCIYSSKAEIERMKKNQVFIAHCPESNMNLASGIAPVRKYLEENLHIGLGTDVAGGTSLSILKAMQQAIQVSKLYWKLVDDTKKPITVEEAFYMATLGGGAFFGKVGSFLKDYEFDAVVVDHRKEEQLHDFTVKERVERLIYLADEHCILAKYVAGKRI